MANINQSKKRSIEIELDPILDQPLNQVITSKYTLLNFIPKNLFEQFRRIANFYFLCIALIQITTTSPVSPATSLVPLVFVIATTALKQAYEDFLRHRSDDKANKVLVSVYQDKDWAMIQSSHLRSGCIVQVTNNCNIPCDMILLHSSSNGAWVTTSNLDGETTLKYKEPVIATQTCPIDEYKGKIICEGPNADLYEFKGVYCAEDDNYPLTANNLLLRGSRLENTSYIYGLAVYTGSETKMSLNSRLTSNKFSSIERAVNRYLLFYFAILFIISCSFTCVYIYYSNDPSIGKPPYISEENSSVSTMIVKQFFNFFVIFNYLIPISLYVSLEMVKFFGSKQLVNDPLLKHKKSELLNNFEKPVCNSSDLNEELGQVEYLFSDKTGTLTENIMRLKACIFNGTLYEDDEMEKMENDLFLAMCLCCSVRISYKDNVATYISESPDEKALVEGASKFEIILARLDATKIIIDIKGVKQTWTKLRTLEFDTYRKRMSVIVRNDKGFISLICKGADSSVFPLLTHGPIKETYKLIDVCANKGLRILVFGQRILSEAEYKEIEFRCKSTFSKSNSLSEVYKFAERELELIGVTAVEDRLQNGVVETISDLKKAGIKVWLLTGDKLETAVSVAYSCNLLDESMTQLVLSRQQTAEQCRDTLKEFLKFMDHECVEINDKTSNEFPNIIKCKIASDFKAHMESQIVENLLNRDAKDHSISQTHQTIKFKRVQSNKKQIKQLFICSSKYALILDGHSLYLSLTYNSALLHKICIKCDTVICSRLSPLQKAEIISLMKDDGVLGAVGDGANDVSMLQQADFGIGIAGKEGNQAIDASDIGVGRFGDLRRVLFVHGSTFYVRTARFIHYFFYKNVAFVTPQVAYAVVNAYSAQTLYHGVLLMCYNMIFTALPIFIYGLKEKYLPEHILEKNPQLYRKNRKNAQMSIYEVISWLAIGIIHGCLPFYGFLYLANLFENNNSILNSLHGLGIIVYHCVICVVTLKLLIMSNKWSRWYIFSMVLSLITLFIVTALYTQFNCGLLSFEMYGIYFVILRDINFWFTLICISVISAIPDIIKKVIENTLLLNNKDKLQF